LLKSASFVLIFANIFKKNIYILLKIISENFTKNIVSIILKIIACRKDFYLITIISILRKILIKNLQYCLKKNLIKILTTNWLFILIFSYI